MYFANANEAYFTNVKTLSGDYNIEVTPVPIPNTEVKLYSADDTWRAAAWESKSLPELYSIML